MPEKRYFCGFSPKVTEGAQNSKDVSLSLKKIAKIAVLGLVTKSVMREAYSLQVVKTPLAQRSDLGKGGLNSRNSPD